MDILEAKKAVCSALRSGNITTIKEALATYKQIRYIKASEDQAFFKEVRDIFPLQEKTS
jgi:hypothetical protein